MKSAKTLFFSVLILFSLTFLSACPVRASETTKITYCSNARELYEALLYHPTDTIILTDDIIWENFPDVMEFSTPTAVYMGNYSIQIPYDCSFYAKGPVEFYGGTGTQPMFLVNGYLNTTEQTQITASGESCTAVQIVDQGVWDSNLASVTACGRNAVAVSYEDGPDSVLALAHISAQGQGALALSTKRPLRAVLSSITSESGTAVSALSSVSLLGCQVYPESPDAVALDFDFRLYDRHFETTGYCYPTGVYSDQIIRDSLHYLITSDDGFDYAYDCPVSIEGLQDSYPTAGDFTITVVPLIPDWFPVYPAPMQIPLHIIAPDQPFLSAAYQLMDSVGIQFFSEITDARKMTLFYSDNNGKTWRDIMELPGSAVYSLSAQVVGLSEDKEYLFCLLVEGGSREGRSNVLKFSFGKVDIDGGGDDDGGDRNEQELPSFNQPPPVTDTQEAEDMPGTTDEKQQSVPDSSTSDSTTPDSTTSDSKTPDSTTPDGSGTEPHITRPTLQTPPSSAQPDTSVTASTNTDKTGITAPSEKTSETSLGDKEQTPVMEQVTDTSTIITGARLRMLLEANPDSVLFEKKGITVEIPSAYLSALDLADHALFEVSIQKTDNYSFTLSIRIDGSEAGTLSESTVTMPFPFPDKDEAKQLSLIHVGTGSKSQIQYLAPQNRASAKIYATGTYTLQQEDGQILEPLSRKKAAYIILYLATGILSFSAVIIVILKKEGTP